MTTIRPSMLISPKIQETTLIVPEMVGSFYYCIIPVIPVISACTLRFQNKNFQYCHLFVISEIIHLNRYQNHQVYIEILWCKILPVLKFCLLGWCVNTVVDKRIELQNYHKINRKSVQNQQKIVGWMQNCGGGFYSFLCSTLLKKLLHDSKIYTRQNDIHGHLFIH